MVLGRRRRQAATVLGKLVLDERIQSFMLDVEEVNPEMSKIFLRVLDSKPTAQVAAAAALLYIDILCLMI